MVSQTEAVRGNERIQQLMEEFPEIHRTLVAKVDLLREGIKPNETTRRIGRWALPEAPWYFEYSMENVHTAEEMAEGYLLSPLLGHFPDGVSWQFLWDSRSPYEVRYEGGGRYRLYRDDQPIEEVFFPARPQWYSRKTFSGKPMSSVLQQRGEDVLQVAALTYCEYFKDGNGCRYCNINPAESTRKEQGIERLTAKREQDIHEAFVAAAQDGYVRGSNRLQMSGGVLLDVSKEADMYARLARVLKGAMKEVGEETPILALMQAPEQKDHVKLKEAGVSIARHNLEVWDPKLFEYICPGKAKNVGREEWMERLVRAVEVFGEGRVSTGFVVGLELMPPHGFKTEDEAIESHMEGYKWMHEHRVVPSGALLRPVPGTIFAGVEPPRTEYFLRVELARHKMNVQYDKVPKPGRPPIFPGLGILSDFPHVGLRPAPGAGPSAAAGSSGEVC